MYTEKTKRIEQVIRNYFEGIFTGNVQQLRDTFIPTAYLHGDIKGADYLKSVEDYLNGVANRKSPKDLKEENRMEILSLEVLGKVAVAKLHVPMLGYNYYDFLSLAEIEGKWKIVNKLFTHVG